MYRASEIELFLSGSDGNRLVLNARSESTNTNREQVRTIGRPVRWAIFARYSSALVSFTSIGDQIAACDARARKLGWTLKSHRNGLMRGVCAHGADGPAQPQPIGDRVVNGVCTEVKEINIKGEPAQ
jgi:hypothetical protein